MQYLSLLSLCVALNISATFDFKKKNFFTFVFKAIDDVLYLNTFHYNAKLIIWNNYKESLYICGFFKSQEMNSYKQLVRLHGFWESFHLPCGKSAIEFCRQDRSRS